MKVAVTGSAGFIGKHVVEKLIAAGPRVVQIDRATNLTHELRNAVREWFDADAVVHCAAHADVRDNWEPGHLDKIEDDNLTATLRTLEATRQAGRCKTFIFISTAAVYSERGADEKLKLPGAQQSPYAASKIAGEAYVQAYAAKCGWRWYVLRPAACFGSGYHHGHIADFVRKAQQCKKFAALDRGLPKPALHVEDLADLCVTLLQHFPTPDVFNVAGGMWSWTDTARVMGIEVDPGDRRLGWLGDGEGGYPLPCHWPESPRPIESGVRDALKSLGWNPPTVNMETRLPK